MRKLNLFFTMILISLPGFAAQSPVDLKALVVQFKASVSGQTDIVKVNKLVALRASLDRQGMVLSSSAQDPLALPETVRYQIADLAELDFYLNHINYVHAQGTSRIFCHDGAKDRIEHEHQNADNNTSVRADYTPYQAANDILAALCP